jgi:tetratricopeptide (TPR) repeat protein
MVIGLLVTVSIGVLWLNFTNAGLSLQYGVASRNHCTIWKYYIVSRALAHNGNSLFVASELRELSFDMLKEAHDCLDAVIASTHDQFAYRLRGDIFFYLRQYAKAARDYESALAEHKRPPMMMDFCPACVEKRLQESKRLLASAESAAGETNQVSPTMRSSELPPANATGSRSP